MDVAWSNFAFVASAVTTGIALGRFCRDPSQFFPVLTRVMAANAVLMVGVTVLAYEAEHINHSLLYALFIICFSALGACTLGITALSLNQVGHIEPEVSEAYSGGLMEWFLQAFGGTLTVVATGGAHSFAICAALLAIALAGVLADGCMLSRETLAAKANEAAMETTSFTELGEAHVVT